MFIIPHGAPEGYEWFVALVVLVGLYFAVRNFMRGFRRRKPVYLKKAKPLDGLLCERPARHRDYPFLSRTRVLGPNCLSSSTLTSGRPARSKSQRWPQSLPLRSFGGWVRVPGR